MFCAIIVELTSFDIHFGLVELYESLVCNIFSENRIRDVLFSMNHIFDDNCCSKLSRITCEATIKNIYMTVIEYNDRTTFLRR